MTAHSKLFTPLKIRELTFKNRLFVSPMCQYSAVNGVPNDWHMVHLGSRAVGGAGLVTVEATAVKPEGRISLGDLGIWNPVQVMAFKPITQFISENGAIPGIQLAHAGRKASTQLGWEPGGEVSLKDGGWVPESAGGIQFAANYPKPKMLTVPEIKSIVEDFASAAKNAEDAGFQVIELHGAHGYLLHEFLSPLSNRRTDEYGGSLENRMRFPLQVATAVRAVWPQKYPLFMRVSATDWAPEGTESWEIEQTLVFARELKKIGVDLIDVSTGGILEKPQIPLSLGYQVPFAEAVREKTGMLVSAVGLIVGAKQAEAILQEGKADVISMARELLRDPYFPLHAAIELGEDLPWPVQYGRAKRLPKMQS